MPSFSHLHVHTQFSLLDGAAEIGALFKKAAADNMPGLAITDHGNMFGAFKFVAEAWKKTKVVGKDEQGRDIVEPITKPVVGCEFYLVDNRHKRQFTKDDRDVRFHQLLLAKNEVGYQNLVKLCSLGFIEGLYGKYPRIDKELILQYHEGLIATTCCLAAEVPRTILRKGEEEGEKVFKWWLDLFGEDYFIELQRHDIPEQNQVNEVLLRWAKKYQVPVIASNDSHYVDQKDANAHDILLCINTGEKQSTPTNKDFNDEDGQARGKRFAFYNDQFYFKTTQEMGRLFADVPEALDNTNLVLDKIKPLKLKKDILLPHYKVPETFSSQDAYLREITYQGARERYGEITPDVEERLNFELFTIESMGFAGYFLIVADFIKAGRDLGVFVGPGRGSAAGSAVAYCIGITNIDPIKYNLLFERFLNPDRKSMPDIDTDFDDEGRQKVIDYVVEKYGKNQVAQIVTYGTMAAKMSIKDVARVLDLPLSEANAIAKLVPEKPGIELNRIILAPLEGEKSLKEKEGLNGEDLENVKKLRGLYEGNEPASKVLKEAVILEGSVRGTGIHAAGIIIAPEDLTNIIPVFTSKETELLITQFEGKIIEDAGVIKMDFLGLKTLTIIRDALRMIKANHGITIDIDTIPLDDEQTFQLYQKGETNGTFQFESAGMQKYLRELKPDKFDDLIAMNALYRPGPLEYIPNFINRKHGREAISFDLPEMEEYLADTYGITVYQEQVMLLSQKLAGFSKGDADVLRKAMGKKDRATLDKMKSKFMEGAGSKGFDGKTLEKIWTDWEAFAQYAFNKSHSTCYAFVAYQTAWLKAHYPAEYMASVLTHNLNQIEKITFFMEECRRMGLVVLGPDVNESDIQFAVNKKGEIRFGLGAIKGVGEAAVESLIAERNAKGAFKSIFDFTSRINLRAANRKTLEALAQAGGFDCFEQNHRAQLLLPGNDGQTGIEKAIRHGQNTQNAQASAQVSLFGFVTGDNQNAHEPELPKVEPFSDFVRLQKEREVIGFYLSGHPLDEFSIDIRTFTNSNCTNLMQTPNRELKFACIVTDSSRGTNRQGKPFCAATVQDFDGVAELFLTDEAYFKYHEFFTPDNRLFIRAMFRPRNPNSPSKFDLKITEVRLLDKIRNEMTKGLNLRLGLEHLSPDLVQSLGRLVRACPGSVPLKIEIQHPQEKLILDTKSRTLKVDPGNDLINGLRSLSIDFTLES